jgi:hypothetical protein
MYAQGVMLSIRESREIADRNILLQIEVVDAVYWRHERQEDYKSRKSTDRS